MLTTDYSTESQKLVFTLVFSAPYVLRLTEKVSEAHSTCKTEAPVTFNMLYKRISCVRKRCMSLERFFSVFERSAKKDNCKPFQLYP